MKKMTEPNFLLVYVFLLALIFTLNSDIQAQCYGALNLDKEFFKYNYIVRLAVHFGDSSELPENVQCCRSLVTGESPIQVPVYFYNAHGGIYQLGFSLTSCDSIASFTPANGFSLTSGSLEKVSGFYNYTVKLEAGFPVCGPALAGYANVIPSGKNDPVWVDLQEVSTVHRMYATDQFGREYYAFSPHHGGYIGSHFMYNCQNPICQEPNTAVTDLEAGIGMANSVKLTWTAGGGEKTMIRYSLDGYPTGYGDGEHVVTVDSAPGQEQFYYHTNPPRGEIIYYTAFSLTMDGADEVIRNSFVECAATDTTFAETQIEAEITSWGALKSRMR
ncbi:MAG: hypothetical protein GF417_10655 [Candidatus Latescibacteria bacterium]|nr:hypothetical protein [bacterium]MBD3424887.1 hypothetical protein [Candidatus Latescibacterota bacterium]